ncbi:uncharacterized protein conserved in cyanobacteria [Rubidibacter lacunae KORDI 51-2]|uniref:Uncharacterized protein conserved in cyanobacteria n=1 Tax=Rubidibacter lacunae KORDI 51-2 TaxID=582515 RepID=U5D9W8_9CHRO|nr:Uma2 family endonuclease [Rubidibacter lacunae]ERN41378.1 uncharacterized protein conserved in cyanobacteria [Rubidibacter lacunae KORDI 51-2]
MTGAIAPKQHEHVILHGVCWSTYEALVRDLESEPAKRLTYNQGILEIMVPLPPHEQYKKRIGRLVEAATEELGIELASLGQVTWKRQDLEKGLEPDRCYYIQNEPSVRDRSDIDPNRDLPPDLAIEIDHTSSSLDRLVIYAALGIPEVWRYDGEKLTIYHLFKGAYNPQEASVALPILSAEDVLRFLQARQRSGENAWLREFRQWMRAQLS